jgi:hypothetical protein
MCTRMPKENMLTRKNYITDVKNVNYTKYSSHSANLIKITSTRVNYCKKCGTKIDADNIHTLCKMCEAVPKCTIYIKEDQGNKYKKEITHTWNDSYNTLSVQFWDFFRTYNGLPMPTYTRRLNNIISEYFRGFDPERQQRNFKFICENAMIFNNIESNFSALWSNVDANNENWGSLYSAFSGGFWSWLVRECLNVKNIRNILDFHSFPSRDEMKYLYYAYIYVHPTEFTKLSRAIDICSNVTIEIQVGYNTYSPVSVNFQLTSLSDMNIVKSSTTIDNDANATLALSKIDADIALVETARNHVMAIDHSVASFIDVSNLFITKYDADVEKWKHDSIQSASEKMSSLNNQLELLTIYMNNRNMIF